MTSAEWGAIEHFKSSEFDSPDKPGSGAAMDYDVMRALSAARARAGIAFNINSGFRTPKHNKAVGGKKNSAHLRGFAADIDYIEVAKERKLTVPQVRGLILEALEYEGFNRFGLYKTFVHVDKDPTLPKNVRWMEGE